MMVSENFPSEKVNTKSVCLRFIDVEIGTVMNNDVIAYRNDRQPATER